VGFRKGQPVATALVCVFDLGNVLLFVHEERFFDKLRAGCGPGAPVMEVFFQHFADAGVDLGGDFDSLHPLLVRDLALTMSLEELRVAWNDIFTPNPPMLDLVRELPRPRVMLSNTNKPHITWIRERFPDILALFDHCVFSCQVGLRKPDLGVFRHVESLTGRPPEQHVFVDDAAENVAAAIAAGWQSFQFQGTEDCRGRLAALASAGRKGGAHGSS